MILNRKLYPVELKLLLASGMNEAAARAWLKTEEQLPLELRDAALQIFHERAAAAERTAHIFGETFGVSLHEYFNVTEGFDIIKFDNVLPRREGESTCSALTRQYGKEVCDMIENLL